MLLLVERVHLSDVVDVAALEFLLQVVQQHLVLMLALLGVAESLVVHRDLALSLLYLHRALLASNICDLLGECVLNLVVCSF